MNKSDISDELLALGQLIGLVHQSGDSLSINEEWFSNPVVELEKLNTRMEYLVKFIVTVMGPALRNPPVAVVDNQWYGLPPQAFGDLPFYLVVTSAQTDTGKIGLGLMCQETYAQVAITPYIYIPLLSYSSSTTKFIINSKEDPIQIAIEIKALKNEDLGFDGKFVVAQSGVSFTKVKIASSIFTSGDPPTFTVDFEGLSGSTQESSYDTLLGQDNPSIEWLITAILKAGPWLNMYVFSDKTFSYEAFTHDGDIPGDYTSAYKTVGDVLVATGFMKFDRQEWTYEVDLSWLEGLANKRPEQIALEVLFKVLDTISALDTPLISLPGGGIYITETERNNAKDYGLRIVTEIPLISGIGTDGKPQAAVDVCFGNWLTGETSGNNWIERTVGKGTLPAPGLSFLFLNRGADGTLSFAPSFVLTSIGLNVKGGAKSPLINLNGYTLNGADLRFYLNPEGQLNNPGAWQYGFAIRVDDVGLPLAPKAGTGGAGGNPVAQNLLSSGSGDGKQSEGADNSAINPPFSAAIAWRSDSTNEPKYNFQLFDKDENPTDKVWLPVQRAFGPLHCQRLGIGWQQPNPDFQLAFLFDGDVALAGLEVDLKGLAVGIPLGAPGDLSKYRLDLDGLDFTFAEGSVEISGGLFKTSASVNGQKIVEYNGEALLKAGTWSVSAVGSWTTLSGHPSLFIFAFLDANIGGPAFFYVTGLSAGFGYNRSLKLPTQDQVAAFPLVAGLTNPSQIGGPSATPGQALQALQDWVPPAQGCYWLAAGVRFTTFELVNSNALIVVEFGKNFEIAILGLARARLPQTGPEVFAYLELGLEIIIDPEDGLVSFTAVVTPNSFVLDPGCHLTGGFAFFAWFGKNLHAGDFVITLGGYHTYFNKPDWYPDEPRLGFNWQVSDQVSISGDAYFALTPSCVMGGGSLDAEFHSGSLSAWFKARADFLMQWKPFYFLAHIGVDMGVALQTDLLFVKVTIKIELGADLSLWGPPVGGLVQVHLWICTITIGFGPPFGQGNDYLPFDEFQTLLPQDGQKKPRPTTSRAKESPPAPLKNVVKLVINRGLVPQTETDGRWLVRADEFVFSVETTFPLTQLDLTGPDGKTTPIPPPPLAQQDKDAPGCARLSDGYYVGVRPMGINCALSELTLSVGDEHKVYQDLNKDWLWTATTQAVPEALWGKAVPKDATPAAVSKTLPGRFAGLQGLAPRMVVPDGPPPIPKQNLSYDPVNPRNENYLPFPQAPQTNQPTASVTSLKTIADTLTAKQPTENRNAIFSALAAFGYNAGNNSDLSALAANVNRSYLAAPLLGSPVTPSRSNQ